MNVDETEISLIASNTRAGGRPAVSFYDPHLPLTSRSTEKNVACLQGNIWQQHCRQVCTSALPVADERDGRGEGEDPIRVFDPHFGHTQQIWLRGGEDLAVHNRDEQKGRYDGRQVRIKYIDNSIIPLYPDLEDTPGKHVLLKVDSGPGRNERELLGKYRCFRGLYIYPGLPNATSVQQEMDLNYGPFKSVVRNNLREISSAFYAADLSIPLNTSTFGLIVYGDTIPVGTTSTITCQNALAETFDAASNKHSWSKVGAVPHTRKCLTNLKVRHDGTDKRDPNFDAYQDIVKRHLPPHTCTARSFFVMERWS